MNSSIRALIVEDNSSWQQILTEILIDEGLQVDVVESLDAAVETLRATPHRLAVVDLSLSGNNYQNQDGLAVLDAVRRLDPGCVTILLSGFATVELAVGVLSEYNALSCLRKETFNRAEFRELVQRALTSAPTAEAPLSTSASPAKTSSQDQVLVVEDDAGWRSILSELLADAGYEVHACASYGEALGLLRRGTYTLAVVDLSLDGSVTTSADLWNRGADEEELGGFRLLASVRAGGTPTIVVSGIATPECIERAYDEHAIFAFVEKQAFDRHAFLQTVEEARAATEFSSELDILTSREREVVELLAQGMTNREIAAELFITTNTVKRHLKSIFEKLDVHTRSAAAAKAVGAGVSAE
ncbi:MAG: response regulator [Anaerolineae bacterium]|nr:response regulator [Anaerolineae bacterium]